MPGSGAQDDKLLSAAVEACLSEQSVADWQTMVDYYASRGEERAERRRAIASRLNLSEDGLRKHIFQLRRGVEECVRARLAGKGGTPDDGRLL